MIDQTLTNRGRPNMDSVGKPNTLQLYSYSYLQVDPIYIGV